MTIELTDKARYELEKENITNLILAAVRQGHNPTEEMLMDMLNIDQPTLNKLLIKLQFDDIIK